jgi:predicted SAM-dependent methyltransferase
MRCPADVLGVKVKDIAARIGITLGALVLFLLLRPDMLLYAKSEHQRHIGTGKLIDEYLRTAKVRKLQIGAGKNNKAGWLNTDIDMRTEEAAEQAYLDATKPFPLPDRSFRYVYSEHVIEHVPFAEGLGMLRETFRVLEPGGRVRIATPDLNQFLNLFKTEQTSEMKQYIQDKLKWHEWPKTPDDECFILNMQLRDWGHQFIYTPKMMKAVLEHVGFRNVTQQAVSKSDDPVLVGLEGRVHWREANANLYETMVFEAVKP